MSGKERNLLFFFECHGEEHNVYSHYNHLSNCKKKIDGNAEKK